MNIFAFKKNNQIGKLFNSNPQKYVFEYEEGIPLEDSISLSMPSTERVYISTSNLHPFFDMFIPEGYLFEIFKSLIHKKEGVIDDFIIFSYLTKGIEGRIRFDNAKHAEEPIDLDFILENDSFDVFKKLLYMFLNKNALSGVHPKTIVLVKDKLQVSTKEYIVKTHGDEFPFLTENEYICMNIAKHIGLEIPDIMLSKNKRFLIVKRFDTNMGFEEIGVLLSKTRFNKYDGSYEQIAKAIQKYTTEPYEELKKFFKLLVLDYLIRNGDAHTKNFGLMYDLDMKSIKLSPAYDIVCTNVYIKDDKPALNMHNKKVWFDKKDLINFGIEQCLLASNEATYIYQEVKEGVSWGIDYLKNYIKEHKAFEEVAKRMIDIWEEAIA